MTSLPAEVQAAVQARQAPHESNQGTIDAIATTGHVVAGGAMLYAVGAAAAAGGVAAAACVGAPLVVGLGAAIAGATVAQMIGADEWLLDVTGAQRLAGKGPNVATVTHPIAHSHAFAGALGAIAAGVLIGAAAVFVIGTGGLGALVLGAAVGGFAGGFVGGMIAGAAAKAADITGVIITGSPDVFSEGLMVARMTDMVQCSRHPWQPPPQIIEGSATIFVNKLPMARIGHQIACAAVIQDGCKTVFGDDTTVSNGQANAEFEWWQQAILSAVEVLFAVSATRKDGLIRGVLRRLAGEPVDVVTGEYADQRIDFEYASVLPLRLERLYAGRQQVGGLLGDKWVCNWSQRLVYPHEAPGEAIFEDQEGQRLVYALNPPRLGSGPRLPERLNSINLKAPYYHLSGSSEQPRITDSRIQQTLVFALVPLMPGQDPSQDRQARLTRIEDRNGNHIAFEYEGEHLRQVCHSDGARFRIFTTADGRLQRIEREGQLEPVVQYRYNQTPPGGQRQVHAHHGGLCCLSAVDGLYSGQFHYEYTVEGWLSSWQDNGVTRLELGYDREGRVIATRTPEGLYNDRFEYDPSQRRSRHIDACGGVTQFEYDGNNLVCRETDPLGHTTLTEWDAFERKVSSTDALGRKTQYAYNPQGLCTQITNHLGQISSLTYNSLGQLTGARGVDGEERSWSYDDRGNLLTHRDESGITQRYSYDERGRLLSQCTSGQTRVVDPHSAPQANELTQGYEYNRLGHVSAVIDANGQVTRYERDAWGRALRITDALGHSTRLHYTLSESNPREALARIEHPDDSVEQFHYDAEGQLTRHVDAQGQTHQYHHSAFDTLRVQVDAAGHRTEYQRDACNRLSRIVNALRQSWRFEYDLAGRLIAERDWAGRTTRYQRDPLGRLLSKTLPDGSQHRYHYDKQDRLTRIEAGQWAMSYGFDETGRLTRATNERIDPVTGSTQTESDTCFEYNAQGQLVGEEQDGQRIDYRYDALGRLEQRDTASGVSRFSLDALGHVSQLNSNGHLLQMRHNALGQETQRTALGNAPAVPGFELNQRYDSRRRLVGQEVQSQAIHAPTQPPAAAGLPPALERHYQWDKASRLVGVTDKNQGQTRYRYDVSDQVRQVLRSVVHTSSPVGTAGAAVPSFLGQESYSYDAVQNIAQSQLQTHIDAPGDLTTHSYQGDTVAQIGNSRYEYDTRGRTISKIDQIDGFRPQEWRYEWDEFDRLRKLQTPEGSVWQYRYDAFGRRVEKRCLNPQSLRGAGHGKHRRTRDRALGVVYKTRSVWQGSQIVEQWRSFWSEGQGKDTADSETVQIDRWHYELGGQNFKPLAKESLLPQTLEVLEKPGERQPQASQQQAPIKSHLYPVVSDHLGTPKELYNLRGECVWQAQHALWGRAHIRKAKRYSEQKALTTPTPHSYASDEDFELPGIDCELRFAGQWEDEESGLHFNFNRYYDPGSGQYLSQDPIGLEGGLRTQRYVSDPLTWVDPLGLAECAPTTNVAQKPLGLPRPTNSNPWMPNTPLKSTSVPKGGMIVEMAMAPGQTRPGGWATTDRITNVNYVRNELAVTPDFKPSVSHVQAFRIPEGVQIQTGTVGPQTSSAGVNYPGGGSQVQILNFPDRGRLVPVGPPRPIY